MTCSVSDTYLVLDPGGYTSLLVHHLKYQSMWFLGKAKLCDDVDLSKVLSVWYGLVWSGLVYLY